MRVVLLDISDQQPIEPIIRHKSCYNLYHPLPAQYLVYYLVYATEFPCLKIEIVLQRPEKSNYEMPSVEKARP